MSILKSIKGLLFGAFMPLYFGGDSPSSTQQTTTTTDGRTVNTTTNTNQSYDLSDRSTTWNSSSSTSNSNNTTNQWSDLSDRSVNSSVNNSNNTSSYDLSNRSTTTTTTNNAYDQSDRSTSNLWDNSNTNSNNSYDLSDRSTSVNNSKTNSDNVTNTVNTTNNDLSDRSTSNLYDSSVRNSNNTTTTNNTTTDFGSVAGALALAGNTLSAIVSVTDAAQAQSSALARTALETSATATASGYHYAEGLFNDSLDFAREADTKIVAAYDAAQKASGNAMSQLQSAYADAKGTSGAQEKIILAVLAVAGVFALSALRR